jgi:cob(I)alamin adenosyltransferase
LQEAYCISKLKHDIRVESKVDLARREVRETLKTNVSDLEVLPTLFRYYPFVKLDGKIVDRMTRLLYLGKVHGFISGLQSFDSLIRLARNATYLREIYAVLLTSQQEIPRILAELGCNQTRERKMIDENRFITISPNTQIYNQILDDGSCLATVLVTPLQTLLEYASEVVKLPYVTFTKQFTDLDEKLDKMEKGVDKGLIELLEHLSNGAKRMPWLGLFKEHIGDYVDWAFSDFRTWGLHFIHKHEGKADPWLGRSCLNLLGAAEGSTILDPFCGSGTFIADAPLLGLNAIGVDINPLSTMISRVKCNVFNISLPELRKSILKLRVEPQVRSTHKEVMNQILSRLEDKNKRIVLGREASVLQILSVKNRIEELSADSLVKDFLYTILSRTVLDAFGKHGKEMRLIDDFTRDALNFYLHVYACQGVLGKLAIQAKGICTIFTETAWNVKKLLDGNIHGIVTSPPYFDALDYYGFSILPITILGLNRRDENLRVSLIGSKDRIASDADFLLYDLLPQSSQLLIRELLRVGREEKARIVLQYLNDMSDCLHLFSEVLPEGDRIIFVVGKYHHWKLGSRDVQLDGAQILIDIGEQVGLTLEDELPHNISKIESGSRIREESIIIWRKGGEIPSRRDPNRSNNVLIFQ